MKKILLLGFSVSIACGTPVPEPASGADPAAVVSFEPASDSLQVSSVVHVHVASSSLSAGAVSLFHGSLSSYYLGKLKGDELPDTLLARRVPVVSYRTGAELIVAPLEALAIDQYSLASADGLVAEFKVSALTPLLTRIWPTAGSAGSPRFAVYCGEASSAPALPSSQPLVFEPRKLSVNVSAGVDEGGPFVERCLHFGTDLALDAGEILVPPPRLGEWALAPALFSALDSAPATSLPCLDAEVALGLGCAAPADDRVVVRTPDSTLLWLVHTDHGALLQVTRPGAPLTVVGLSPSSSEHLWGSVRDETGAAVAFDVMLTTNAARERLVLNESLADALGPEPQSEWVELFNDGTLAVDVATYTLKDGGGSTALPHAWLAPKEYALLVREDFAPNGSDEPPATGARLIRVPTLGKSGLSNAGERLALVDDAGVERSVLPALAGKPGQSLARRTPESADGDPSAFGFGTPTPGFANDALSGPSAK